jgi:hypothetical protein
MIAINLMKLFNFIDLGWKIIFMVENCLSFNIRFRIQDLNLPYQYYLMKMFNFIKME